MNYWIGRLLGRAVGCPCHEDLFDFALDGLDRKHQGKVRQHLSDCPHCRDQIKDYAWVSEGIALSAPQIDPPGNLCDKVKARILAEGLRPEVATASPKDALAGWPRFWMRLGPIFMFSSLGMAALVLGVLTRRSAQSRPISQTSVVASVDRLVLKGSVRGAVELFLIPGGRGLLLRTRHLAAGSYDLWIRAAGSERRVGTVQVTDSGGSFLIPLPSRFRPLTRTQILGLAHSVVQTSAQAVPILLRPVLP